MTPPASAAADHPTLPVGNHTAVVVPDEAVAEEELLLHEEEAKAYLDVIEDLAKLTQEDFPDDDTSPAAARAAAITRAYITEGTRSKHARIVQAYIAYHLKLNTTWDPRAVTKRTPLDIIAFITQKCGEKEHGFEGRKYATAVSTRAAITLWYRSLHPNDGDDWVCNTDTGECHGLPTRSRTVAQYMIGLEKTKAKAGEISQSMRALTLNDMKKLHDYCLRSDQPLADLRWGVVRWVAYLHAFLMMLRMDEVIKLTFESFNIIPGETEHYDVHLGTRKSAQTGVSHGWKLWANDGSPWLCPYRSIIQYAVLLGPDFDYSGSFLRQVNRSGAIIPDRPVTAAVLSRALSSDLQALGNNQWAMYGTHSFRRGGCQYRIKVLKWSVDMVASWGGWTQVEAITMFRYYYSPNDNHEYMAEYDRNMPKRLRLHY